MARTRTFFFDFFSSTSSGSSFTGAIDEVAVATGWKAVEGRVCVGVP